MTDNNNTPQEAKAGGTGEETPGDIVMTPFDGHAPLPTTDDVVMGVAKVIAATTMRGALQTAGGYKFDAKAVASAVVEYLHARGLLIHTKLATCPDCYGRKSNVAASYCGSNVRTVTFPCHGCNGSGEVRVVDAHAASSGVTHEFDVAGRVVSCSEAVDFLAADDVSLTGYGFCHHYDNTNIGNHTGLVWVGYPPVEDDHAE